MTFADNLVHSTDKRYRFAKKDSQMYASLAQDLEADDAIKRKMSKINQNEKYLRRINLGCEHLEAIKRYMEEAAEQFDNAFKQLLSID
jgi:hypothetical protein